MNYNKYNIGPYNIHIINTDKFKTINIKIVFKRKLKKEEITIRNLLSEILLLSTKNFSTERLMNIECEKLYDLYYRSNITASGNYSLLSIEASFLNSKYTEGDIFEKVFLFLKEIIFNPNIENNRFNSENYNIAVDSLKKYISTLPDNTRKFSLIRMLEEMDPDGIISYRRDGYIEDFDNIDEGKLYEYYLSMLKSDIIDIFVVGDIDSNYVKDIITNNFKINTIKKETTTHYIKYKKYRKRAKTVIEKKDISQSKLVIGCKLIDVDDFELKYVSSIYSIILGGGTDSLLFKNVREKNSLCYSINSTMYKLFNVMVITSGIDASNAKKTISLIKRQIKNISIGNFDDELISNAKAIYINSCLELLDSPFDIINSYISYEYLNSDLLEEKVKKIDKVTKKMIIDFSKKVKLDTIFLLEGGTDE